ncbi:unnamed protein product, partial [Brassica oleracea]
WLSLFLQKVGSVFAVCSWLLCPASWRGSSSASGQESHCWSHSSNGGATGEWSLEKLWNRVSVLGLGVSQVLFVACGGQQVPENLEGFRRYAMISQCCGLFLD